MVFTLELTWPIVDGRNPYAVCVESTGLTELARIASNADFRAWARCEGCAFIEIWNDLFELLHFERP